MSDFLAFLLHGFKASDLVVLLLFVFALRLVKNARARVHTTKLPGPPSDNLFFGLFPYIIGGGYDPLKSFERWGKEFGSVYTLPMVLGRKELVIGDVKAASHFLARDTFLYHGTSFTKVFIENLFGWGILSAEQEDHRRLRKALTPAFSNAAIRGYVTVFNDSCSKLKNAWDALLDSGESTIEVQQWMNNLALDNLGIAGFSHHFGALDGKRPEIIDVFGRFASPQGKSLFSKLFFFLAPMFPVLLKVPTENARLIRSLRYSLAGIADSLLENTKAEMEGLSEKAIDKSVIGLLIKAEGSPGGTLTMTSDEVLAQNTLFVAGYETTSVTLTWALIELSRNPRVQAKLRQELEQLEGADPTWEQMTLRLPYLDAVTQETLRMHPPVVSLARVAQEDDIVPLSKPVTTASGETVSELIIAKGQILHLALGYINISEDLWGADVKEFKPERWIDAELNAGANAIQGHHHLMTFSDGPRFCLGRHFALANFKTSLINLVRTYSFELPYGKETEIGRYVGLTGRPRVAGEMLRRFNLGPLRGARRFVTSTNLPKPTQFPTTGFTELPLSPSIEEETLDYYKPEQFYPIHIGEILNARYQVVGKLGYGATGTSWLCRDISNHKHVTLKVGERSGLEPELAVLKHIKSLKSTHPGASVTRPLLDEFELRGAKDHVFLCAVHPPLATTAKAFRMIISALRDDFPLEIVKNLVKYILHALDFLHTEAGVVHTDIQEGNILLSLNEATAKNDLLDFENLELSSPCPRKVLGPHRTIYTSRSLVPPLYHCGPPVLCDFGEARFGDYNNLVDIRPYQYRAPEVIFEIPWDEKVDIWNVGVMLWDILGNGNLFKTTGGPEGKTDNVYHLAHMVALLGPPPIEFLERTRGKRLWNWFDDNGNWKGAATVPSGTLEEAEKWLEGEEKKLFLAFARKMLQWKPEDRYSARELLEDPWLNG